MFAQFVKDNLNETFKKSANAVGKLFLEDGDPSQNSKTHGVTHSKTICNA